MQIFFRTLTGKNIALEVEPTDTVWDVKDKLIARGELPRGVECYRFIFRGKQLINPRQLNDYKIVKDSTIHLLERFTLRGPGPTKITVNAFEYTFDLEKEFDSGTTILDVKKAIEEQEKIPINVQTMMVDGMRLQDEKSLGYYDFFGGNLHLVTPQRYSFPNQLRIRARKSQWIDEED